MSCANFMLGCFDAASADAEGVARESVAFASSSGVGGGVGGVSMSIFDGGEELGGMVLVGSWRGGERKLETLPQ